MMMNKMTKVGIIAVIAGMMFLLVMAFNVSNTYAAGNDFDEAEELTLGTKISGTGSKGYWNDYYYIDTTSNNSFYVMNIINSSISNRVYVYIYDEDYVEQNGSVYACCRDGASDWWKLLKNARYYIQISGYGAGDYKFTATEVKDDAADYVSSASKMKIGKEYTKTINVNNDKDWFSFNTDGTDAYYKVNIINMSCNSGISSYDEDINDIGGSIYARSHNSDYTIIKPAKNSKCYFEVKCTQPGQYKIKVTKENDPAGETSNKALAIKAGKKIKGRISCGKDDDWYKFKVPSTGKYNIDISKGSKIYIYDSKLQQLGSVSNQYSNERGKYELGKLKKGKTYYLCANGSSSPYNYSFKIYKKVALPGKPAVTVSLGRGKVVVKFNKPSKAVKFEIAYKTGNGSWKYKKMTKILMI